MLGRDEDARGRILNHFGSWRSLKVPLYLASGGGVAMVFQLPEPKLVPIQAFIIGCTWPAVVANYISGRQTGVPEQVQNQADQATAKLPEIERRKATRDAVPHAAPPPVDTEKVLKEFLEEAEKKKAGP